MNLTPTRTPDTLTTDDFHAFNRRAGITLPMALQAVTLGEMTRPGVGSWVEVDFREGLTTSTMWALDALGIVSYSPVLGRARLTRFGKRWLETRRSLQS